jgi:hypothetical protein
MRPNPLLLALLLAWGSPPVFPQVAVDPAPATMPAPVSLPSSGYLWAPQLAPRGPMLIVISLAEQRAYVYRNGVRIGMSAVSTGKPGYDTPTGVFTILQKHREHYSSIYDNAPMPFMQRLTWSGVALHAGKLPGYPASHGCIRLPYAFSEKLFGTTATGMTVVVTGATAAVPTVVHPELFSQPPPAPGLEPGPVGAPSSDRPPFVWAPERSPVGPLTLVLSTRDHEVVVLRNAIEIGHAAVTFAGEPIGGTHAYMLLQGTEPGMSRMVPDRPARRWLEIAVTGATRTGDLRSVVAAGQLGIDPTFARQVYDALVPGSTLVVTDEPIRPVVETSGQAVLQGEQGSGKVTPVAPPP